MIIVRLLSPERSWLVVSHQSLLGYRSRHCHGINFTLWEFQASASRAAKIVGQLPASGQFRDQPAPEILFPRGFRCARGALGHLTPCFRGDFFSGNSYLDESLRFSSRISSGRRWKTAEARSHLRLSMAG